MKALLMIVGIAIVAGSFYTDYRWKRWMANQRERLERERLNQ